MSPIAGFVIALIVLLVVIAARGFRLVRQWEKGLIEQFGRYQRTVDPGLRFIVPFVQNLHRIDMREQVVDVPPQEVITRDNVVVTVDAVVYYQATDPVKLKYNVANFIMAATKLAQTNLRNVVGDMQLERVPQIGLGWHGDLERHVRSASGHRAARCDLMLVRGAIDDVVHLGPVGRRPNQQTGC